MVYIQKIHPLAIEPSTYNRVRVNAVTGEAIDWTSDITGITFESFKKIDIQPNVETLFETGWSLRLKGNQCGVFEITNSYLTPITIRSKFLTLGFEGELSIHIQNTQNYPITIYPYQSVVTLCIYELKESTIEIVRDVNQPSETFEADSTV